MSTHSLQSIEGEVPHLRNLRRSKRVFRGTAWILTPALIATAMVTGFAAPANATDTVEFSISPDTGPTAGGTEVYVNWTPPAEFDIEHVAAGWDHSLAIATNGNTYAWGSNERGQLGDGGSNFREQRLVEVALPAGVTLTSISAGRRHSLGIASNGKTYAWGDNVYGQLGTGAIGGYEVSPVEVQLPAGVTFTSISAGAIHSLALGSDNRLYAWGNDAWGQLGNGAPTENEGAPVAVALPGGTTITSFSGGDSHSLAVGFGGTMYAWGSNGFGQLGVGIPGGVETSPVPITLPSGVTPTQVSAGNFFSGALGSNGQVYLWGNNAHGQLGEGTNLDSPTPGPALIPGTPTIKELSVGQYHVLATSASDAVYAWGNNTFGKLGDGTNVSRSIPVLVSMPAGVIFDEISAKGRDHSMAIGSDGNAYTWGGNEEGQLGNNFFGTGRWVPTSVYPPLLEMTGVFFDGVAGTALIPYSSGYRVVAPAHMEGTVDVTVQWSFAGVTRDPQILTDAYTYVEPVVAPDAPIDVSGIAGDGEVLLTWSAPGDDGGSPVTDYEIEFSSDGGIAWTPFDDGASDALEATTTGLTNGTEYVFQVRAISSEGSGPWSAASEPLTPETDETEGGASDIVTAEPTPSLSATGSETTPAFVLGGVLLAAGCAILLTRLRRRA